MLLIKQEFTSLLRDSRVQMSFASKPEGGRLGCMELSYNRKGRMNPISDALHEQTRVENAGRRLRISYDSSISSESWSACKVWQALCTCPSLLASFTIHSHFSMCSVTPIVSQTSPKILSSVSDAPRNTDERNIRMIEGTMTKNPRFLNLVTSF